MNRRGFIKGVGMVAGGALLAKNVVADIIADHAPRPWQVRHKTVMIEVHPSEPHIIDVVVKDFKKNGRLRQLIKEGE